MRIERVGVIGAGVMGRGVAQNLSQTGHQVVMVDIAEEILEQARAEIYQSARFARLLDRSASEVQPAQVLDSIVFTTDYNRLHDVDFVVENTVEKWDVKRTVYPQLDAICPPYAIFAANTSCMSITRIGAVTRRPDRIVGMHFMNPVPLKSTVEVIRGYHTSDETIARAHTFLSGMGKEGIVVNDAPGFVSNRVLMLTINEAIFVLQDRIAEAEQVDLIFKNCFGHKMGPLETADLIGLDTILFSIEALYEGFNDSKYRPCPLLKKMVDAGLHGRKSGQGFYSYQETDAARFRARTAPYRRDEG